MPVILKERINKCVPTDKTIHILFHEQVCGGRYTKWKKTYLISIANMAMWLHCFLWKGKS